MFKFSRILKRQITFLFALSLMVSSLLLSAASAAWKDEIGTFRIGVLNSHPAVASEATLSQFTAFYASQLGVDVEVIRFQSLGSLMDAHGSARVHYAIHSARSYATMSQICNCLEAVVRPKSESGASGFRSVFVVNDQIDKESAGGDVLRVGYSNKTSMSGWIVPKSAVDKNELPDANFVELGNIEDVLSAFSQNEIDGFFGWVPSSKEDADTSKADLFGNFYDERFPMIEDASITWWSNVIHHGPHVVHKSLPSDFTEELKDMLLNMPSRSPEVLDIVEPYFSGGFEEVQPGDYTAISTALNLSEIKVRPLFDGKLRTSLR